MDNNGNGRSVDPRDVAEPIPASPEKIEEGILLALRAVSYAHDKKYIGTLSKVDIGNILKAHIVTYGMFGLAKYEKDPNNNDAPLRRKFINYEADRMPNEFYADQGRIDRALKDLLSAEKHPPFIEVIKAGSLKEQAGHFCRHIAQKRNLPEWKRMQFVEAINTLLKDPAEPHLTFQNITAKGKALLVEAIAKKYEDTRDPDRLDAFLNDLQGAYSPPASYPLKNYEVSAVSYYKITDAGKEFIEGRYKERLAEQHRSSSQNSQGCWTEAKAELAILYLLAKRGRGRSDVKRLTRASIEGGLSKLKNNANEDDLAFLHELETHDKNVTLISVQKACDGAFKKLLGHEPPLLEMHMDKTYSLTPAGIEELKRLVPSLPGTYAEKVLNGRQKAEAVALSGPGI